MICSQAPTGTHGHPRAHPTPRAHGHTGTPKPTGTRAHGHTGKAAYRTRLAYRIQQLGLTWPFQNTATKQVHLLHEHLTCEHVHTGFTCGRHKPSNAGLQRSAAPKRPSAASHKTNLHSARTNTRFDARPWQKAVSLPAMTNGDLPDLFSQLSGVFTNVKPTVNLACGLYFFNFHLDKSPLKLTCLS